MRRFAKFAAKVINSSGFVIAGLFSDKQNQTTPALGTIMNQNACLPMSREPNAGTTLREWVKTHPPPAARSIRAAMIIKDTPSGQGVSQIACAFDMTAPAKRVRHTKTYHAI